MEIVLHVGALFTEEDRLLRSLLGNKQAFSRLGVSVPGPGRYKGILRETINAMISAPPAPNAREIMLDLLLDDENAHRVILQQQYLFGVPLSTVREGIMYYLGPSKAKQLPILFDKDEVEICITMRNPATFLPALMAEAPQTDMMSFLRGADPFTILWSDTLSIIRDAAPSVNITAWCFEDLPLIWGKIIREMADVDPRQPIHGEFDLLSTILSREGMRNLTDHFVKNKDLTEEQSYEAILSFIDEYAMDDALEEEVNAPGWNASVIDDLTQIYDDDMQKIAQMPGVDLIMPSFGT